MAKIVAVRRGSSDMNYSNQMFKLDNGQEVTDEQAYDMAKSGQLEGVVGATRKGNKYIRGINDGDNYNNLDNLPSF